MHLASGEISMEKEMNNRSRGIIHILLAAFGFAMMSFFVKLSGNLPVMEKAFFRNLVAIFVSLFLVIRSGEGIGIHDGCLPTLFFRSAVGFIGIYANFWAISNMAIADANMLNKLSPFAAIIMSIFLLKEKPALFDIITVILAFIGAGFIIKPSAGIASFPAIVGVLGGVAAGTAYTLVRKLGLMGERKPMIVLFFSVFSCVCCLPFMILDFVPMTLRQFLCLVMAGVSATVGQMNVTAAYSYAPAREISVFDYSQVLFAAVLGFLAFGEIPDAASFIGYAIIIGTAVVKWRHDLKVSQPS